MAYEIIWSENALEDYNKIVEYLVSHWPSSVSSDFVDEVNTKLENLSRQPLIGLISIKNFSIRSILLSPHNRLYYSIGENFIELLDIVDTRSNPLKNPF